MYTKDIILTETSVREWYRRKEFWQRDTLYLNGSTIPAKMENPVRIPLHSADSVRDYLALFEMLLDHPYAHQLCVRHSGQWAKRYREQLDKTELTLLAAWASAADEDINYLEMKYKDGSLDDVVQARRPWHRPVIRFAKIDLDEESGDKKSVGYQLHLPVEYQHLFDVKLNNVGTNSTSIHGFWVP